MTTNLSLFDDKQKPSGPVECLGQTFPSDEARREHYLAILREKLKDPAFRKIEGFPIGSDEDILALSDPPYYTACPNPFIEDFIASYGKPYDPAATYSREPLTVDVSVGKTDAIYKAHGYHTKVPHLAIVPSILHYTEPGDLVLDGFAGSGMTGVAAQWCGTAPAAYRHDLERDWKAQGKAAPEWGPRRAILNDLSPAATFIAANYNLPFDTAEFAAASRRLLKELENEIGWMYETLHVDGKTKGQIDYTVWSQVYSCPECAGEVNFFAEALHPETKRVKDSFPCPHCGAELTKQRMERLFLSKVDPATSEAIPTPKRVPTLIVYSIGRARYEKTPDTFDFNLLEKVEAIGLPTPVPTTQIPPMHMTHERARMDLAGITRIHHFFTSRAAQALGTLWKIAQGIRDPAVARAVKALVHHQVVNASVMNRYRPASSFGNAPLGGVYYVSSLIAEASVLKLVSGTIRRLQRMAVPGWTNFCKSGRPVSITTQSATNLGALPANSVDYVFTDPPFGENIYYADLNFMEESWHRVFSNAAPEAIVDRFKHKALPEYQHLMQRCFSEYFRVLKPGRWMTVVFSNSRASVWNAIQVALQQAGFVVAEVTALDKQQGSYRQVTSTTAVKQDLVISAYKPNGGLEERFAKSQGSEESAWDFVRSHLRYLPTVKVRDGQLDQVVEREPRIIFDRLVAWLVRHNVPVPVSAQEFQAGLAQRFAERDGMAFLPEQVTEYDKKRLQIARAPQMELFIADERSAIDWLSDFLKKRPSTYQEIHPEFIRQLGAGWKKHEAKPELSDLLEGNFLCYDPKSKDGQEVPSQIHSYLSTNWADLRGLPKSDPRLKAKATGRWYVPDPNKARDLEMVRERTLLKEFEGYRAHTGRRLKVFRLEAMRAGFRNAWTNKDYTTIVAVAKKVPEEALQEDEKLLLWYDQALTRMELER